MNKKQKLQADTAKNTVALNLKKYRMQKKFTQKQLADMIGVANNTISSWESATNSIDTDSLYAICQALNVTMNDMYSQNITDNKNITTTKTLPNIKSIPIVGTVACGTPIYAEENIQEYVTVSINDNVHFALYAKGDSMNKCKIDDGDLVYIHQQDRVENGEIALVVIDDTATIKRFYDYGDKIVLRPDSSNPNHKEQVYDKSNCDYLAVQGKVIFIKTYVS